MAGDVFLWSPPEDPAGEYLARSLAQRGLLAPAERTMEGCRALVTARLTPRAVLGVLTGGGEPPAELVFGALWAGKPVWVPMSAGTWQSLPRSPLGRMVGEGLELLMESGLVFCPLEEIALRAGGPGGRMEGAVTARRVEEAARQGRRYLTLGPLGLVTPLAADRAGELGMTIEKRGRCGAGTGPGYGVVYPQGRRPGGP